MNSLFFSPGIYFFYLFKKRINQIIVNHCKDHCILAGPNVRAQTWFTFFTPLPVHI